MNGLASAPQHLPHHAALFQEIREIFRRSPTGTGKRIEKGILNPGKDMIGIVVFHALPIRACQNHHIPRRKLTQEEVAKQVGKSRSAVANSTRLLDLPDGVKELVKTGQLSAGHAKVLLSVHDEDEMVRLALNTVSKSLSVRETEKAIKVALRRIKQMAQQAKALDDLENGRVPVDYTAELAKKMTARLGHRVTIKKSAGDSRIEIHFADDAELGDIVADICGDNIFDE